MALIHSMESSGNWLFRKRSFVPLVLFLFAIPAVYFTDYSVISNRSTALFEMTSILLATTGFIIRAYTIGTTPRGTSGRNTNKQFAEQLNSSGIYSVVRHPLYLGNYLMWIGIVLFTKSIPFAIIVSLLYWIYYERIMFAEERYLERKFGEDYLKWSLTAPAFFPALRKFRKSDISFSLKSVLRREYSGVLATVIGFAYVEFLINLIYHNQAGVSRFMIILLVSSAILTIILRTLKHQTKLLSEEGRS